MNRVIQRCRYLLLDLDGTLTNPQTGITKSVAYALQSLGIDPPPLSDLLPFIGPPLMESFERYFGMPREQAALAVAKYREYFTDRGIFENEIYPGIPDLLNERKAAGNLLILATSKPTVFAARILRHFAIDHYFTFVSGSELSGERTDKAQVIEYALKHCGIENTSEACMIGDRKHDVLGAKKMGLFAVGVSYGFAEAGELKRAGADIIVDSVDELRRLWSST